MILHLPMPWIDIPDRSSSLGFLSHFSIKRRFWGFLIYLFIY